MLNENPDSSEENRADSFVGTIFDSKYRILEKLGSGAKGAVYKAVHLMTDNLVAVKVLHKHLLEDKASLERFRREAKVTSQLDDPHMVKVRAFSITADGWPYLVMECLDGKSLDRHIEESTIDSLPLVIDIFKQVAEALKSAESHKIVHRDLKPANIMVIDAGDRQIIKILDFGLAKIIDGDKIGQNITVTQNAIGSPAYMSPEQCAHLSVDIRSDIYSLGCVVYELLCGVPPFSGSSEYEIMLKQLNDTAKFPKNFAVQETLKTIVLKCLAKDPHLRYQTVDELLNAVDSVDMLAKELPGLVPNNRHKMLIFVAVVAGLVAMKFYITNKHQENFSTDNNGGAQTSFHKGVKFHDASSSGASLEFLCDKAEKEIRYDKRHREVAMASARQVIDMVGNNPKENAGYLIRGHNILAEGFLIMGNKKEALKEALKSESLLPLHPDQGSILFGECYCMVASCYRASGSYVEATEYFKRALKYQIGSSLIAELYGHIADMMMLQNKPKEAIPYSEQCIEYTLKSGNRFTAAAAQRRILQIQIYLMAGEYQKYKDTYPETILCVRKHPDLDVLAHLSDVIAVLSAIGRVDEAVSLSEIRLKLFKSSSSNESKEKVELTKWANDLARLRKQKSG